MGSSVRPDPDLDSLIAARRKALGIPAPTSTPAAAVPQGDELDALIASRRQALGVPAAPRPGLGRRVADNVGHAVEAMVTHPIDTLEGMVTAPFKSFADAVLAPSVGEARPNPSLSKGGNSAGLTREQLAQPFDAEHGAVTGRQRFAAGVQTIANVAAPSIAGGVTRRFASAGAPAVMGRIAGMSAAGGAAGAAYSPEDPLAGGLTGMVLAPVLGETTRLAGKAGGKVLTATGMRPTGRSAAEIAGDRATMSEPVGPQAGAAQPSMAAALEAPAAARQRFSSEPVAPTPVDRARARFGRGVEQLGVESSRTIGLRELARRLEEDNVAPADAVAFSQANAGKPVAVLDLGGGNVAGLARTAKDVPGVGRRVIPRFLGERSGGATGTEGATLQRVVGDVEQRIGLKPEDYYRTVDDMVASQKATAATDYGKVRHTVVDDPEVLSLFNEPEWRAIHDRIAANARLGGGEKIPPLTSVSKVGGVRVESLNPQSLGTLDLMKRQLDKVIAGKSEALGPIDRDLAFNMRKRLNTILDRMDELHPDYATARANYRGSAEAIDAYELGKQEFMGLDPRAIQAKLSQMPERLRDLYRRGGYDALRTRLGKIQDGGNVGSFLEKSPDIRDRVAALAKTPEEAAALGSDIHVERAMGDRKNQILGGPNTAERIIEHQATVPQVTRAGNAVRGVPVIGKPLGWALDNRLTRGEIDHTSAVMGEVAKMMVQQGPEAMQELMRQVEELRAGDAGRSTRFQRRAGQAVGTVAGQAQAGDPRRR